MLEKKKTVIQQYLKTQKLIMILSRFIGVERLGQISHVITVELYFWGAELEGGLVVLSPSLK